MDRALAGKVALLAGATRGAGRGTAVALGEAGATVYCTGCTSSGRRSDVEQGRLDILVYDLVKNAVLRLAFSQAEEFKSARSAGSRPSGRGGRVPLKFDAGAGAPSVRLVAAYTFRLPEGLPEFYGHRHRRRPPRARA
jgi:NAD(P)-dependent dehydrogenase (short-subunit alcohol dehydrogenase family)